ncbi:MAG: hypothetical protein O9972_39705 [Burkholderiales bacterium]|nr:hypothetical protein [Burkholderiales bacterium]
MSDNSFRSAQVHRFRDHVAASLCGYGRNGSTVYMTPGEARALAAALTLAAYDCMSLPFVDSRCGTFEIGPGAVPPVGWTPRDPSSLNGFQVDDWPAAVLARRAGAEPPPDDRAMYRIVRHWRDSGKRSKTGRKLMSLSEAQAHCRRDDTRGPNWFDGYEMHPKFKKEA